MQTTSYAYHKRGWLKSSTSNEFSMRLDYEEVSGQHNGTAQFNGDISGQHWGAGGTLPNIFTYSYDGLNRLSKGASTGIVMSEELNYDVMGNIIFLKRDDTEPYIYS